MLIDLLVLVIVLGLVAWGVTAIPMPQPFKVAAYAIMVLILVLWLAAAAGHPLHFPKQTRMKETTAWVLIFLIFASCTVLGEVASCAKDKPAQTEVNETARN